MNRKNIYYWIIANISISKFKINTFNYNTTTNDLISRLEKNKKIWINLKLFKYNYTILKDLNRKSILIYNKIYKNK